MCTVSYVGDFYGKTLPGQFPNLPWQGSWTRPLEVSREEFDRLKAKVDEMVDLLKKAKEIDAKTGQPDCEMDEKMALLRPIAAVVGVRLDDALKEAPVPTVSDGGIQAWDGLRRSAELSMRPL